MIGTFNKHSSLAISDKHLVRQTNQGWPKMLPQYPPETALTVNSAQVSTLQATHTSVNWKHL